MKAAVSKGNRRLVVEDIPDPVAGLDDVVVQVKHVGICGSDLHLFHFDLLPPDYVMGHEFAGVIASVGSGVTGWKEGDRVWVCPGGVCGTCKFCREGHYEACQNGISIGIGGLPGGYAEYVRTPASLLVRLPGEISTQEAALVDPVGCGHQAASLAQITKDQSALVMGAGPIGLYLILCLKSLGVNPVILSEPAAGRRKLAGEIGADVLLNPTDGNVDAKVKELTGGLGPHVVFECVGIPQTVNDSMMLARTGGTVVWIGVCMEPATIYPAAWFMKQPTLHVSLGFGGIGPAPSYLKFIHDHQDAIDKTITETISIDGIPEAFERLMKPNDEAKILVEF